MRYLALTLTTDDGGIHPVDRLMADHPAVERDALLHADALFDATGVLLYRLRGDPDALLAGLDDHPAVIRYDLLDRSEDSFHLYVYVDAGQPAGELMHIVEKYALVVDTPVPFTADGGLKVTVGGAQEMIEQAFREIPDDVTVDIQEAGSYAPRERTLLSQLTDRQQEVLETAVVAGYYELPRQATQADVATELGCTSSTVDEHLRKVESRILSTLVR